MEEAGIYVSHEVIACEAHIQIYSHDARPLNPDRKAPDAVIRRITQI